TLLDAAAVAGDYEAATDAQIVATFAAVGAAASSDAPDHRTTPMVLLAGHAPFAWGGSAMEAAYHAVVLEEMARIAALTLALDPHAAPLPAAIADKHYFRKHGALATYGQQRP
nr:class II aldolase/adducin family protein [Planctomycetota bacterium]